jgi:hypothetical protein
MYRLVLPTEVPVTSLMSPTSTRSVSNGTPRDPAISSAPVRKTGPLRYLDQAFRDTNPVVVTKVVDAIRSSVPQTDNKLVELRLDFLEPDEPPRCTPANLKANKLVTITSDWRVSLHVRCLRDELRTYVPNVDKSRTARTIELAVEEVASLWCGKGRLRDRPVSLSYVEDIVCSLILDLEHHVIDAITLVKTLIICGKEELVRSAVARLSLQGGTITELQPTITKLLAQRRVLEGQRVAVIDVFRLRVSTVRGSGLASLVPTLWAICPVRVVELGRGVPDSDAGKAAVGRATDAQILVVTTETTSSRVHLRELESVLEVRNALYCKFMLYDTEEGAVFALSEIERYIDGNLLREEMETILLSGINAS